MLRDNMHALEISREEISRVGLRETLLCPLDWHYNFASFISRIREITEPFVNR